MNEKENTPRLVRHCVSMLLVLLCLVETSFAQIPRPDDAPQPLSPEESAKRVKLPPGLRMELVASEPLVREPSGVCWDEFGRMFVCELHGYNVDGQIDIDELNKSGKLDTVVRRFFVPPHIEEAARKEMYGTVKLLTDTDGDGRMDKAVVWADRLPSCFGVCPARGGIIVVCAPDIVFLADRDDDGKAEVREVLYTGFPAGLLERRMGTPQWGLDDWIYVSRAHAAATISGPHLPRPVALPNTNFRIKADGSAIEPVSGEVGGLGFTFTEAGDCFVSTVGWPAHLVAPLPWHALARNPFVATGPLTMQVFPDRRVYPTSKPHPWRSKRADDPGFSKFYTDGYGVAESAPNGYFTSCCGPLVYQDSVLPGLKGQLLACEPAQNLIHRSVIERNGLVHQLRRAKGEEHSEFCTSTDAWFHPIALSHGPDGAVWIADFYREIIEDYSAIPRYLQQQYGVTNGKDHGRIWRIVADEPGREVSFDMSKLNVDALVREVASPLFWRRQTARRLLIERQANAAVPALTELARSANDPAGSPLKKGTVPVGSVELPRKNHPLERDSPLFQQPAAVINALHTLSGLGKLLPEIIERSLTHSDSGIRRQSLQLAEKRLDEHPALLNAALQLVDDADPLVRLQLALSLGATRDRRVMPVLSRLARQDGDAPWMATAILTALHERGGQMLAELLREPAEMAKANGLLEPLCAATAARRDKDELSAAVVAIAAIENRSVRLACLRGIRKGFSAAIDVPLSDDARETVRASTISSDFEIASVTRELVRLMRLEKPAERDARIALAMEQLQDVASRPETRLIAIAELVEEDRPAIGPALVAGLPSATPRVRQALLEAVFARRERLPALLDGIEQKNIAPVLLSAVQRNQLLTDKDDAVRSRAAKLLKAANPDSLAAFPRFAAALREPRDVAHGQQVFRETCGKCHQAHGIGVAVGPDLSSEFQRAEETIIKDILAPSETISPGYMIYSIATKSGQVLTGLLASESPTSVTLKQPEGKQQVVLRNEIDELRVSAVSMMPEELAKQLKPKDVADVIAWLRQPQQKVVLLDDNQDLVLALNEGTGTAEFVTSDKFSGESSLLVTPPQRFSPRIPGWEFRIREQPAIGEYRYIRFAWKAPQAAGVMLELADNGQWPPAQEPVRRYFAGKNLTGWQAVGVAPRVPADWTQMTRDLWKDFGNFTLTGFAPTAIGGPALFDRIELLRNLENAD